jgi:hypothetical protein
MLSGGKGYRFRRKRGGWGGYSVRMEFGEWWTVILFGGRTPSGWAG